MAIEEKTGKTINKLPKKEIDKIILDNIKFLNIEGQVLHVKVGGQNLNADDKMIFAIENYIEDKLNKKGINTCVLVTHHLVDINILETRHPSSRPQTLKENNEGLADKKEK